MSDCREGHRYSVCNVMVDVENNHTYQRANLPFDITSPRKKIPANKTGVIAPIAFLESGSIKVIPALRQVFILNLNINQKCVPV
jgi:hypothetical protein